MIEGIPLKKIEENDYYRRFLLVKTILLGYQQTRSNLQEFQPKYLQLYNDMLQLQENIRKSNQRISLKNYKFNAILDSIDIEQQKYISLIKQKRSNYEAELMKRWRSIINSRKQSQKRQPKQVSKGNPNKNLMFLTSQILKKQRTAEALVLQETAKIQSSIKILMAKLQEQNNWLKNQNQRILISIKQQKIRVDVSIAEVQKKSKKNRQEQERKLQQNYKRIQSYIAEQNSAASSNQKQICQILESLINKIVAAQRTNFRFPLA